MLLSQPMVCTPTNSALLVWSDLAIGQNHAAAKRRSRTRTRHKVCRFCHLHGSAIARSRATYLQDGWKSLSGVRDSRILARVLFEWFRNSLSMLFEWSWSVFEVVSESFQCGLMVLFECSWRTAGLPLFGVYVEYGGLYTLFLRREK